MSAQVTMQLPRATAHGWVMKEDFDSENDGMDGRGQVAQKGQPEAETAASELKNASDFGQASVVERTIGDIEDRWYGAQAELERRVRSFREAFEAARASDVTLEKAWDVCRAWNDLCNLNWALRNLYSAQAIETDDPTVPRAFI